MASESSPPLSLFHADRAQCPDCGAALALEDIKPRVQCGYCGCTSVVERRLRTIQPVIDAEFITADAPVDAARSIKPSHIVAAIAQDESHCPGCGAELEAAQTQAIRRCPYCLTQSKTERRLLRSPETEETLIQRDTSLEAYENKQFAATEALIDIVEKSPDLAARVRAGWELGEMWCHVNVRAARLLPRILEVLRTCDVRLELHLAELVGKLLCSDDVMLANAVLRAAEKFTFDVNGSRALLRAVSLGSGVGLKLLLDTADYAATRGATLYACYALWSVNTMIERNYAGRMRLADVVLYRLLYLRGPVQAWAIELAQGQLGLGCRFPTKTLLRFIDDCAGERPELIPQIERCFYEGRAATHADYTERLFFINALFTSPAQAAAIRQIGPLPEGTSDETIAAYFETIIAFLINAALVDAVARCIYDILREEESQRPAVRAILNSKLEAMPAEPRKAFDDAIARIDRYAPTPTELEAQLKEWNELWNRGIREAVADYQERQTIAREHWQQIRS